LLFEKVEVFRDFRNGVQNSPTMFCLCITITRERLQSRGQLSSFMRLIIMNLDARQRSSATAKIEFPSRDRVSLLRAFISAIFPNMGLRGEFSFSVLSFSHSHIK